MDWEKKRSAELEELLNKGTLPIEHDADLHEDDDDFTDNIHPYLMGVVSGLITKRQSAKEIVDELVTEAAEKLSEGTRMLGAKL